MKELELFNFLPEKSKRSLLKRISKNPVLASVKEDADTDVFSILRRDSVSKPVILVGSGTCGLGAGANKTLEAIRQFLAGKEIDAEVLEVGCIGLCSAEPLVDVQLPGKCRLSFRNISADKVDELLGELLMEEGAEVPWDHLLGQHRPGDTGQQAWKDVPFLDEHPFFGPQSRWVLANCGIIDPGNIDEYLAFGGYSAFIKAIYSLTPAEVCDIVEKSGLRGRGGGGFLTGKKWKFALNTDAEQTYMVCNADEGDPGAFMDRAVIEGDPHRLLEGLAAASYAIGASKAYIYIRAEYPLAIKRLKKAIADAKEYGFLGNNIMDSGFSLEIKIKQGAGAFVCGEETALMHSIEGKRGMPRPRPPYPAANGLFGKPTIINNVETLANIPPIIQRGHEAFSSIGTENSKGTKVFALSGKVRRTGLIEVEMGTTIRDIVFSIGGGIPGDIPFKGVQIGGPSGGCIPTGHLDIQVDYESLKTVGAMMGSGGLVVMDEQTCMVDVAKFFMDFIQRESCGKCIPCREGTKRMLEILQAITRSRRNESGKDALIRFKGILTLEQLAQVIKDTSLCGLGQSAPNPVLSTLRWFKEEYEEHIFNRRCPAGVCAELLSYSIDAEKCTGCTACMRKCPANAIMGNPKTPHYIIPDKCIACGNCVDICRFGAINAA
jgi:NADH:ubiquinone oxidoreductase subunit F (NADH-binding)/Pyruvate/2-oxoacid:ferredoxin oxidoreductase delta subunit